MATVRCPSCERALEVEDAYRDWTVRCPHCDGEFVPDAVGTSDRRPRRREEPDDRPRDEDYSRDDRDGPDSRDDRREAARAEALQIVAAPALWLEIVGWLGALFALGLCALFLVLAIEFNNANRNAGDEVVFVILAFSFGVFGVPYSVAMAVGARKMRDLSSRGWAMTAGILGVAAFSLFGVCGLVQAGFGAWALVSLENPAVRTAFGLRARWRPRRRREWDD